jgi:predicted amidohydrolase
MKIAGIQHDILWEDAAATRARVTPLIAQASANGARIIALTEMYATGFSMRPERIAEDEGGPNEQFLLDQAGRHDAYLIASIAQRGPDGSYYNNGIVAGPDGSVQRYAKIHPFTYSGEHEHYTAGDKYLTVTLDGLRVSLFVCYDLRFADEFWLRAQDTDLYVVVANWPEPRREHWRILLPARAVENQAYVLGVNRVGTAKSLEYLGDSTIVDPLGRSLAEAAIGESVITADIDSSTVSATRTSMPFLQDRRVHAFG